MKKIFLLLPLFLLFSRMPVAAQKLLTTLEEQADKFGAEKVYLHYDKSTYLPGETVWFKAYLMEALFPATASKTLYVDWVSESGEVLHHSVSPLVNGVTSGQFDVPSGYTGQFIQVKAYTRWMLNFDSSFLYSKTLRILQTGAGARTAPALRTTVTLQFFPEGGDLVSGVDNRVAFKAVTENGFPVKIRGTVTDAKTGEALSFATEHDGMGSLVLKPKEGSAYTARWKDEKGADRTTTLPAVRTEGVVMQVTGTGDRRQINLFHNGTTNARFNEVHLVGTLNGRPAFSTDVAFNGQPSARRVISMASLPSGVMTITLFDASWNAIGERITFVNNNDYSFRPQLEVQRWGLNKRARNEIQLSLPDSIAGAHLSVSVTDAAIDRDTSDNIIAHLLLSAELRGYIHRPAYYFANNSDTLARQLDLVMLTNGWRRFKWEDLVQGKMPRFTHPRDTGYLFLSGKLFGLPRGVITGKETIAVIVTEKDSSTRLMALPIQTDGSFADPTAIFFDTLRVHYSLKAGVLSSAEARFMLNRLPPPNYQASSRGFRYQGSLDTLGLATHRRLAAEALRLQEAARGKLMEAVIVKAKAKTPAQELDERYTSPLFKTSDGFSFDLVNDPSVAAQPNVLDYLRGRVPGLQITPSQAGGTPTASWRGSPTTVFLDEVQQQDLSFVTNIPITDIAYVKVLRPPFFGAPGGGAGGAIAIYTRRGNDARNRPGSGGLPSSAVMGYTPIREFYSPNYATFNARNEQRDLRTTLYWNPALQTSGKNRTIRFHFYNNDTAKAFRVVIEGISREGLLTHYEEILE
jgi:hypothetical protein